MSILDKMLIYDSAIDVHDLPEDIPTVVPSKCKNRHHKNIMATLKVSLLKQWGWLFPQMWGETDNYHLNTSLAYATKWTNITRLVLMPSTLFLLYKQINPILIKKYKKFWLYPLVLFLLIRYVKFLHFIHANICMCSLCYNCPDPTIPNIFKKKTPAPAPCMCCAAIKPKKLDYIDLLLKNEMKFP